MKDEKEGIGLYVVIPSTVRHHKDLIPEAKLLYGDICGLSKRTGFCYASTEHLCDVCGLSKRQVLRLLKNLEEHGFISRATEGLLRHIRVTEMAWGGDIKGAQSGDEKGTILLHTTNTDTITRTKRKKFPSVSEEEVEQYFIAEKGLAPVKAKSEAESFMIYHTENGNLKDGKFRARAHQWYKNAVAFGKIKDPGPGKTEDQVRNFDTGMIDTSRWEKRGDRWYAR